MTTQFLQSHFCYRKKKKNKKRRYWVHPLNTRRIRHSQFYLLRAKLRAHPDKFFDYHRMSIKTFDELLDKVRDKIKKQNTWMRFSIDAEERLTITLRFLATGKNFEKLKFDYFIGSRTVSSIVKETCQAIWDVLQPLEMKPPSSKERWLEDFYERTNFPNVVGAVDGEHIRLISPMHSGSNYYNNYKNYFSIVLLAVVDSDYRFIAIDVGSYGRENTLTYYFDEMPSPVTHHRSTNEGRHIRDNFAEYFITPAGEVVFQYNQNIL
ncbi:hypothetical protein NQ315_015237 [Exocentrus adspersus]|uniref:DDE Tnp4 domain-containing protein n=1 Tax=Exocentrus adspersus TaxID=1586481 RepID=A0AAV8VB47_9CUCU|nr:hypothetical protein NQ315_015237 [Exocentrus adspersus]